MRRCSNSNAGQDGIKLKEVGRGGEFIAPRSPPAGPPVANGGSGLRSTKSECVRALVLPSAEEDPFNCASGGSQ